MSTRAAIWAAVAVLATASAILIAGASDLAFTWAILIAAAVFVYVLLDGFDLGLGILFPLDRSDAERDTMINSVAPVWDGNETWLVLNGGGLFAAFPVAYAVLMPAFYSRSVSCSPLSFSEVLHSNSGSRPAATCGPSGISRSIGVR